MRIGMFIPVRLGDAVVAALLECLDGVLNANKNVVILLYDDNEENVESSELLRWYAARNMGRVEIVPKISGLESSTHRRNMYGKGWSKTTIDRIIRIKNYGFSIGLREDYDYLIMYDSDMLMNPALIKSLVESEKDIVAGITWTRFQSESDIWLPNCWDYQTYEFYSADSIVRLRDPGIYRVGGLAAATCFSRRAMERGVTFERIQNLEMWGEDKHLCVRAAVLGFELYVNTYYPIFHVYRDSDLAEGLEWLRSGADAGAIRRMLDGRWEKAVRERFRRRERAPEQSVRRKVANGLRRIAQMLDAK